MSGTGGISLHPESETRSRTSTGAPQKGQVEADPSLVWWHQAQV
jgi:hypothetical protein